MTISLQNIKINTIQHYLYYVLHGSKSQTTILAIPTLLTISKNGKDTPTSVLYDLEEKVSKIWELDDIIFLIVASSLFILAWSVILLDILIAYQLKNIKGLDPVSAEKNYQEAKAHLREMLVGCTVACTWAIVSPFSSWWITWGVVVFVFIYYAIHKDKT